MADYLINGLKLGFDIDHYGKPTLSSSHNLKSAMDHPKEIAAAINKEQLCKHIAGPFLTPWD